jgi:hypothetical protein
MNGVRINRVTAQASAEELSRARHVTRRAAELLGEQLAMGDAIQPQRKLVIDVPQEPGWTDERLAQRIARELRSKLG